MNYFKLLLVFTFLIPIVAFSQIKEKNIDAVVIKSSKKKLKKKDNPAYEILQQVWKHKKNNGLSQFQDYQYNEYEKIQVDVINLDSTFTQKKIFNKVDFIFKYADTVDNKLSLPIYFNETVYKNWGKKEPVKKEKKEVLANKASGFSSNEVVANTAKNLYKDINIYDNILNFFNIGFTSPVAKDGFMSYDYELLSDQNYNSVDCYRIKYTPKRKDVFYHHNKDFQLDVSFKILHNGNGFNFFAIKPVLTDIQLGFITFYKMNSHAVTPGLIINASNHKFVNSVFTFGKNCSNFNSFSNIHIFLH